MEYLLTAELTSPADSPDLDPLQQVGVVSLLDSRLNSLVSIEGPDGTEITPIEHSLKGHLGGAIVNWLLDAPALVLAEDATRTVLDQLLEETELLAGWQVKHCAVTATDDQLESALAAGDAPDFDLAEGADYGEDADDAGDTSYLPEEEEFGDRQARLIRAGEQLRAIDLEALGDVSAEEARYVAGALMHGIEMLTDELFGDIQLLEDEDATAAEVETLWVLDELPEQYADRYGALFAKQLLVTTAILGFRLARPGWEPALCLAEALALHLAKSRAELELDLAGVLDEDRVAHIFGLFDEIAFGNRDHEVLYDSDAVFADPGPQFEEWFRPRQGGPATLHPYLADEDD